MKSPFAWDLVTRNLVAMALSGVAFFMLTLLCEFNFFNIFGCWRKREDYRSATPIDEDYDVARERRRVLSTLNDANTVLRVTDLTKIFKKPQKHLAVNRLCLDIFKGECFGLLGVNGAGKSTTFKMLTGDIDISSGDAIINQFSVRTDKIKAQQHIGYCPQFDALFDELTAREHLKFYARLRGVKLETEAIEAALKRLELTQFADEIIRTYSGGTKRKLSAAIALISSPPIVFLVLILKLILIFFLMKKLNFAYCKIEGRANYRYGSVHQKIFMGSHFRISS
jgi:ATP-binding cassette subfamily A (ABC1) protein 2